MKGSVPAAPLPHTAALGLLGLVGPILAGALVFALVDVRWAVVTLAGGWLLALAIVAGRASARR